MMLEKQGDRSLLTIWFHVKPLHGIQGRVNITCPHRDNRGPGILMILLMEDQGKSVFSSKMRVNLFYHLQYMTGNEGVMIFVSSQFDSNYFIDINKAM